ncbi:MAG: butyrate kinase [Lachnospiraceae bacterium]|nr:butyrate kinase [Lachnospiraceae bacterium]
MKRLLIINPGSTSTKIAVFEDEKEIKREELVHSQEELKDFSAIMDQVDFRKEVVKNALDKMGYKITDFDAVVARGGVIPPIKTGAYKVNDDMIWQLKNKPVSNHASNLGAVVGSELVAGTDISVYIYDAVGADEMLPILKMTGLPELKRSSQGHNLNIRANAIRYAKEHGKELKDCNLIVAHLGGGASIALFNNGRIIDIINDEDGPFTPERAGALPMVQLCRLFLDEKIDHEALFKRIRSHGGFLAYYNTNDARDIEKMIDEGDEKAKEFYSAFAINIAKNIGKLAPVVKGKVDAIILTGGIARSKSLTAEISDYVSYIAPVTVYAGENEMQSLALGILRVLNGQEEAHTFEKVLDFEKDYEKNIR